MASTNGDGKSQVAFSLAKKKKKKNTFDVPLADFSAQETSHGVVQRPERSTPLVIPVQQNTMIGPKKKIVSEEDSAAAQALMESAQQHFEGKRDDGTNFSADGSLTIKSAANTFERKEERDAQQFQCDLKDRPEDIPVDSNVYHEIPIAEFGAALLRGMGWQGDDNSNKSREKPNDDMTMPRPHRLGLGATPKLPEPTAPGRMRRPDQVARDTRLALQQQEYEEKRRKQIKLDKQQTLQNGSIIAIQGKRARMVQLMGVPGLNRVLVQFEGESPNKSFKRGDVVLVSRDELDARPFVEQLKESKPKETLRKTERDDYRYSEKGDRKRIKREEAGEEHSRRGDKRRRDEEHDHKHSSRDRSHEKRHDEHYDKKQRRKEPEDTQHWLIPNIRVRVVTKKLSSRQYKQKGLVLDVTHGGAYATLQMPDGQLLDRVPERYLETALPKVGGNAIVLTGKHRFSKGKLLERSSDSGTGVIQAFEDMNVLKLSLDDIAEWCGPLDDDLEL
jgi:G patch domain/KOW motif-containing protein